MRLLELALFRKGNLHCRVWFLVSFWCFLLQVYFTFPYQAMKMRDVITKKPELTIDKI